MSISHLSRSPLYRNPAGAAPEEEKITFVLLLSAEDSFCEKVELCYTYGLNNFHESKIRMRETAVSRAEEISFLSGRGESPSTAWQATLQMPSEPGLFFYWFKLKYGENTRYFSLDPDSTDGNGRIIHTRPRISPVEQQHKVWQITVFCKDYQVPSWLTGAVFYQIFPDRFARDKDFTTARFEANNWPERIFHENWDEDVDFRGKLETGYLACDFYGGSLNGIRERLDELVELGIDAIYLNPVFKARSNHRYDTGDYEQIDPLLGTEKDFRDLCNTAAAAGIKVILDGVFSHTGADSRYFNKLDRYQEAGAYQEVSGGNLSRYSSWYTFHRKRDQVYYDSWWGFTDLPCVNEHDLSFQEYIAGEKGILRKWLRLGASGWRLDVSDELPDDFLRLLRKTVKQENTQAILMGEVWEDASSKISYGSYRDFLFGRTHDNIMGYPFQQAVLGWLSGQYPAEKVKNILETLQEHYPLPAFYSSYNLISSHDIPRAITVLAGVEDPGSREEQARRWLDENERSKAEKLLELAFLIQVIYPGIAVVYYGDEIGMEGFRDPFNRRTFPAGSSRNSQLRQRFCDLGRMRRKWPVLRSGFSRIVAAKNDCLVICRYLTDGKDAFGIRQYGPRHILAAINRSGQDASIKLCGRTIWLQPFSAILECDGELLELEN